MNVSWVHSPHVVGQHLNASQSPKTHFDAGCKRGGCDVLSPESIFHKRNVNVLVTRTWLASLHLLSVTVPHPVPMAVTAACCDNRPKCQPLTRSAGGRVLQLPTVSDHLNQS